MPRGFKTICTYPGCNTLVLNGRCSKHNYTDDRKQSAQERGYDSVWTRLRNAYVRAHPICQIQHYCDGDPVEEVDHIKPIRYGGDRLDERNLQSACKRCHAWKTANVDPIYAPATGKRTPR